MNNEDMFDCAIRELKSGRYLDVIGGGQLVGICLTEDGCAATITTRYDNAALCNMQNLGHYPMTGVMEIITEDE